MEITVKFKVNSRDELKSLLDLFIDQTKNKISYTIESQELPVITHKIESLENHLEW